MTHTHRKQLPGLLVSWRARVAVQTAEVINRLGGRAQLRPALAPATSGGGRSRR